MNIKICLLVTLFLSIFAGCSSGCVFSPDAKAKSECCSGGCAAADNCDCKGAEGSTCTGDHECSHCKEKGCHGDGHGELKGCGAH